MTPSTDPEGIDMTEPASDLVAFLRARLDEDERMALSASYWPDDECHPGPFRHDHWVRRHVNETGGANLVRTASATEGQPTPDTSADPIPDGWVKTHEVTVIAAINESRMPEYLARHIARHDPARVLAEVKRERRIIDLCVAEIDNGTDGAVLAESVLFLLAEDSP